jgi:hypothetical protein
LPRKIFRTLIAISTALILILSEAMPVYAAAIDVGSAATNRASSWAIRYSGTNSKTIVAKDNPANDSGTLTNCDIYLDTKTGTANVFVGTFSAATNVLTCRDSEGIGDVTAGSTQSFTGLTITVSSGDYIGTSSKTGTEVYVDKANTGGAGGWVKEGEYIDPTDTATFLFETGYIFSLYATGATAAGAAYIPKITWH